MAVHQNQVTRIIWILLPLSIAVGQERAGAQDAANPGDEIWRRPTAESAFTGLPPGVLSPGAGCCAGHVSRIPLFGMVPGFLTEPLGLENGDDSVYDGPGNPLGTSSVCVPGKNPVVVAMGLDNPYFDYPGRNDFGGVGYYKVHSQVQLLDQGSTALCLGLQAVTPAGIEAGGVMDGPTKIRPAFAWFQELGDGTALHGFVSKTIRAHARWSGDFDDNIDYGMALQYTLPGSGIFPGNVYFFLEALGRYHLLGDTTPGRPLTWEFIPGIHWRMGESWWLSIGAARRSLIKCSWQF